MGDCNGGFRQIQCKSGRCGESFYCVEVRFYEGGDGGVSDLLEA